MHPSLLFKRCAVSDLKEEIVDSEKEEGWKERRKERGEGGRREGRKEGKRGGREEGWKEGRKGERKERREEEKIRKY